MDKDNLPPLCRRSQPSSVASTHLRWLKFNAGDWLLQNSFLSLAARGALINLFSWQWYVGGSIPSDDASLAAMAGCTLDEWNTVRPAVMSRFERDGDRLFNPSLRILQQESAETSEKLRAAGRRGREKQLGQAQASRAGGGPGNIELRTNNENVEIENKNTYTSKAGGHSRTTRARSRSTSLPENFSVPERARKFAKENHISENLDKCLEIFKGKAIAKGYTYANWDQAFINAIREGWARPQNQQSNRETKTDNQRRHEEYKRKHEQQPGEAPDVSTMENIL